MKLKFSKKWLLLGLAPLTAFSVAAVSSCEKAATVATAQEDLTAYKSLLWQISPEHVAHELNVFNNATRQYDEVMKKNRETHGVDTSAIKWSGGMEKVIKATPPSDGGKEWTVKYDPEKATNYTVPVVVVDLDETFMDNTMHGIWTAFHGSFSKDAFQKWINAEKAPLYAGVIDFVKHVWMDGGVVLFDSNRNMGRYGGNGTGDQLFHTRKNLIDDGYPKAFLDTWTWWMDGVTPYGDTQTENNAKVLSSKEERYNYINKNGLKSRTAAEMGLSSENGETWADLIQWDDHSKPFAVNAKIVMKMGDNLNDFNSNLLASDKKENRFGIRENYMKDKDIRNLFGKVGPAVWFTKEENNPKPVKHISSVVADEGDKTTLKDNVSGFKKEDPKLWQTYCYVGGNSNYGDWLNTFLNTTKNKNNVAVAIKQLLFDYVKDHGGWSIFPKLKEDK